MPTRARPSVYVSSTILSSATRSPTWLVNVEATHLFVAGEHTYQLTKMTHKEQHCRLGRTHRPSEGPTTHTFELCAREAAQIFGGLAYTRGGQGEKVERLIARFAPMPSPEGPKNHARPWRQTSPQAQGRRQALDMPPPTTGAANSRYHIPLP